MENLSYLIESEPVQIVSDLYQKSHIFFQKIQNEFDCFNQSKNTTKDEVSFIIVTHCYDNSLNFIRFISNIGKVLAVIPKSSTKKIHPEIISELRNNNFNVMDTLNREKLRDVKFTLDFIKNLMSNDRQKLMILDHGGYFSEAAIEIEDLLKDRLMGIVEFTNNGYKRYESLPASALNAPILSSAISPLKKISDKEVGESIAHYIDHIVRISGGIKVKSKFGINLGVIGYGLLGSSVAKAFRIRGVNNIAISDVDYFRLLSAIGNQFNLSTVPDIIKNCNLIVSATGAKPLTETDFRNLRNHTFLATVTSADDELGLDDFINSGLLKEKSSTRLVTTYSIEGTTNVIYLIAGGESVNTLLKWGSLSPAFFLIEAEYLSAIFSLIDNKIDKASGVQEVSDELRKKIIELWINSFGFMKSNA